jgi:nucleoside-diphosphate-sugar epimerase
MRVLVTGGRGLLGSAVVRELVRRGHVVTVYQRTPAGHAAPVVEILGDVTDAVSLGAATVGQEAVVHLAARVSMVGPWEEFVRANVDGTRNVLDAAEAAGIARFVQISSPSVAHAGEPLVGAPATAADPDNARGAYARSKAMAELEALGRDRGSLAVTAVRPHLVWGPGDTQLIGRIAERARAGRLVLVDDGAALIDTTYVDNAAEAIAQALDRCEHPDVRGRAFVVSNGQPRTVAELVARIALAAGGRPPTRHLPFAAARIAGATVERAWVRAGRSGEPPLTAFVAEQLATAHWFDQRETRRALDWRPRVGIEEGLVLLARSFAAAADAVRRGAPTSWPSTDV